MFQSLELKHPRFYQIFRLFIVVFASILYAWNLRCFAKTAGLFPSGFSGASLLLQNIGIKFLHISVPFAVFNIGLNLFPTYISYVFTDDIMLVSLFGGLINGLAISLCLNVGTSTGGTDFISIFLSHQKGIDAWNYILLGNIVMLIAAGALFGWSKALYSIIYQFCSTQVIQLLYKRYKKETLFIISDKSNEIYHAISDLTHHDATLFKGVGCYEEKEKTLIYSVINSEAKRELIPMIRGIDEHAFINVVKTEELDGRFHDIPHD